MRTVVVCLALIVLGFAPAVALDAGEQAKIEERYRAIQGHICEEANLACVGLTMAEKWAVVATWCSSASPDLPEAICPSPEPAGLPAVIAFHHDARSWRAIYGLGPGNLEVDANGIPRVLTRSGTEVVAIVEGTNPLVYTADAGVVTESDAEVVAALKALFKVLGPALSASVQDASRAVSATQKQADEKVIEAVKAAAKRVGCIPEQWTRARGFTQRVENSQKTEYILLALSAGCSRTDTELETDLEALEKALKELRDIEFCADEAARLRDWIDLPPTDLEALREAQKTIRLTGRCDTRFHEFFDEREKELKALEDATAAAKKGGSSSERDRLRAEWRARRPAHYATLSAARALGRDASAAIAAGDALLAEAKKKELRALLVSIARFEERLASTAASLESFLDGTFNERHVPDFFVVPRGAIEVAWTKTRSRTLTVSKSTSLEINTRRPETVSTSYRAASLRASLTGVSVAITHTDVANPEFGMVSEPAPTEADLEARHNVIRRVDQDSRSGELAVLAAIPVFVAKPWARRWSLELGAGAGTSNPALFLGVSHRLGAGVRLGVGWTAQQVKELDGQQTGDPITAEGDIKLRNDWSDGWYASFSLSLESIGNLFDQD
jgi:hypothetical protein